LDQSLFPVVIWSVPDFVGERIAVIPHNTDKSTWKKIAFWVLGGWFVVPDRLLEMEAEHQDIRSVSKRSFH
jgi:hypothetical protein